MSDFPKTSSTASRQGLQQIGAALGTRRQVPVPLIGAFESEELARNGLRTFVSFGT